MNQYIRDFHIDKLVTYPLSNAEEAREILQVNQNSHNFKIIQNNIRSIGKNLDEFRVFVEGLNTTFECIVLTETRQIHDPTVFHIDGYETIYNQGNLNQNDGVVIFIKSELYQTHKLIELNGSFMIKLKAQYLNKIFCIYTFYRSPNTDVDDFLEELNNKLNEEKEDNCHYSLFLGDINIDLLNENMDSKNYLDLLGEFGYISAINTPTRVQRESETCLDHIFIYSRNNNYESLLPITVATSITDHYTTILQIVLNEKGKSEHCESRKYFEIVKEEILIQEIKKIDWNDILQQHTDLDILTNTFIEEINECVRKSKKRIKIKNKERRRKNWITTSLVKQVNKKNDLYRKWKNNQENERLKSEYLEIKKQVENKIKQAKISYYRKRVEKEKNSSKQLWNTVNEILNIPKPNKINNIENEFGEEVTNYGEIANIFNKFFVNVGKNLASNITKKPNYTSEKKTSMNSIYLEVTDETEVMKTINDLKNKKSAGSDGLKAETLKIISKYISKPLTYIINKCFDMGFYPAAFKSSIVIPVYKSGDEKKVTNYRPISLTTTLSKVFEKIIQNRLNNFLKKFNLLSTSQFGFREHKSTQDAIHTLTKNIYECLDKNMPCLGVFIDLTKAFDTVDHNILLATLDDMGIRGTANELFRHYLTNRKQKVRIKNYLSSEETITCGVPQGTVLGPILFTVYIDNLFSQTKAGKVLSFADDTVIIYKSDNWYNLKIETENNLNIIKDWFDSRLLTINFNKTKYVAFSSFETSIPNYDLVIGTNLIRPVKEIKYLGIFLDAHLRWDKQTAYLIKKLRCILYRFREIQVHFDIKQKIIIYQSLVEPHLRYGIIGWGSVGKNYLNMLEISQKRFLKMILNKGSRYPSDSLYHETEILDIRQLYSIEILITQHQNKNELNSVTHSYPTRQRNRYLTPIMKKAIGQKSYQFIAPKLYNHLPDSVKNEAHLPQSKKQIKAFVKHMGRHYFHKIIES